MRRPDAPIRGRGFGVLSPRSSVLRSADPLARQVPTLTFADVAQLFGFHEVERLFDAARGALDLLREISPRLVVADFAPTVRLASSCSLRLP